MIIETRLLSYDTYFAAALRDLEWPRSYLVKIVGIGAKMNRYCTELASAYE
jgi:hypothetical protein